MLERIIGSEKSELFEILESVTESEKKIMPIPLIIFDFVFIKKKKVFNHW